MLIPYPTQNQYIIDSNTNHARLREASNKVLQLLAENATINNMYAVLKTADTHNKIEEVDLMIQKPLHIILNGDEMSNHDAK